jgi:hypothetical protein
VPDGSVACSIGVLVSRSVTRRTFTSINEGSLQSIQVMNSNELWYRWQKSAASGSERPHAAESS